MRILICASEAPLPPFNGARLVLHEICRKLALQHEVSVVAFRWPDQQGTAPPGVTFHAVSPPPSTLPALLRDRLLSLARREPIEVVRLCSPMRDAVARLGARQFDIAHVMLGPLAGIAAQLSHVPTILAPLDAWTLNLPATESGAAFHRLLWLRIQRQLVIRYLRTAYRPFARVVFVSGEDEGETLRLDPTLRTAVIGNGVDADHFDFQPMDEREPSSLLFTGTLSFAPNIQAARFLAHDVLPRVRAEIPSAQLQLVGRDPDARVRQLSREPGVSVYQNVEDVQPHLAKARAFVCAMISGTGVKNKLLEAMASGAPAVATSLACRGLAVRDNAELLIADDADSFAAATVRLLKDHSLAGRLADTARRFVLAHHSWAHIAARYEALYMDVLNADHGAEAQR